MWTFERCLISADKTLISSGNNEYFYLKLWDTEYCLARGFRWKFHREISSSFLWKVQFIKGYLTTFECSYDVFPETAKQNTRDRTMRRRPRDPPKPRPDLVRALRCLVENKKNPTQLQVHSPCTRIRYGNLEPVARTSTPSFGDLTPPLSKIILEREIGIFKPPRWPPRIKRTVLNQYGQRGPNMHNEKKVKI